MTGVGGAAGPQTSAFFLSNVFAELHLGEMLLDKAAEGDRYQ